MGALQILDLVLPLIEKLPTLEQSVVAFVHSIGNMVNGGVSGEEIVSAIDQSLPRITDAIVANTSASQGPEIPVRNLAPAPVNPADLIRSPLTTGGAGQMAEGHDPTDTTNIADRASQG